MEHFYVNHKDVNSRGETPSKNLDNKQFIQINTT